MLGAAQPPWYSSHRWLAASWLPPTGARGRVGEGWPGARLGIRLLLSG